MPDPITLNDGAQPLPGPIETDPDLSRAEALAMLRQALDGLPLGQWDRDILTWLTGMESAVPTWLASMLRRARVRGFSEAAEAIERRRGEL